jgi:hypothetical protein
MLVTLLIEAIRSSETSVLTRATRHNNAEYDILQFVLKLLDVELHSYSTAPFLLHFILAQHSVLCVPELMTETLN